MSLSLLSTPSNSLFFLEGNLYMPDIPHTVSFQASGEDIFNLINKVQPLFEEERTDHVIMACLAMIMILMNPNITPEELTAGIKSTSQFVCNFMETTQSAIDFGLSRGEMEGEGMPVVPDGVPSA